MPYKLVSKAQPDVQLDGIVLARDEDGNVTEEVSVEGLTEDQVSEVNSKVEQFGYEVVQVGGDEVVTPTGPVGADTVAQAPVVVQEEGTAQVDQQASAVQQKSAQEANPNTPNS